MTTARERARKIAMEKKSPGAFGSVVMDAADAASDVWELTVKSLIEAGDYLFQFTSGLPEADQARIDWLHLVANIEQGRGYLTAGHAIC